MLNLPNVTLALVRGLRYDTYNARAAIDISTSQINFGAVLDLQLAQITDIDSWNAAVIFTLPRYINTSHCLLIHGDGYVINPMLWRDEWIKLDYIGSPWPLPNDDYSYRTPSGQLVRVGNSVSLRSKRLMDLASKQPMLYHFGNNNEDGQICVWLRDYLEDRGCKFATFEQALEFGKEHELPENKDKETFVFHT